MRELFADQPEDPVGGRLGRYRILEKLGSGGMGIVYRAEDTELGREVALKVLPPELVENRDRVLRFEREARTLASLSHPCIIALYAVEEIDGQLVLVMELAQGRTLGEVIPPRGYGSEKLFRLAIPLVDGLATAHARGIVHRDLKPANVVVTPEDRIKILDFGLAKLRDDLSETAASDLTTEPLTAPGALAGTAAYMAPEQIRGASADERSDIFAVGILLYQMATGQHPFRSKTDRAPDVVSSILRDDPPSLTGLKPELPRHLERILRFCLEKDPEKRVQSAKDLRNQLEMLEKEMLSIQKAPAPPAPPRRLDRRAGAAALAVLALAVGFWVYRQLNHPPPPSAPAHLAVTEFRGLSGETAPAYYREGLVSVLNEHLAGLDGVWLVPPDGDPLPDLIVHADVSKVQQSLTLLVEVEDRLARTALGSEVLHGGVEDPYALLDDTGTAIAGLLRDEAGFNVRYRPRPPPTRDPEAFDLYLQARTLSAGEGEGDRSALALAERAAKEDPGFGPAWILQGELHLARWLADRDPDTLTEAAQACRRALRIGPEHSAVHLCLARVHHAEERLVEAEEGYVRAIELDATALEAYEELGEVFQELGNPDRGVRTWKRILDLHPRFWGGYSALGSFYYNSERHEAAIEQYRRALDLAPRNAKTHWKLGAAYHELGRYEEAITAYQASLDVRPSYQAYSNLGFLYFELRRFPKAVDAFERAVAFPRADFIAAGNLAMAYYWSSDRRDEAKAAFERAAALCRAHLSREPRSPDAWIWLAYDLAMLERKEESLAALERALELRPNDPHYLYFTARVYNRLGQEEQAIAGLERAVEGGYPRSAIRLSIEFDDLRDHPKVERLLETS